MVRQRIYFNVIVDIADVQQKIREIARHTLACADPLGLESPFERSLLVSPESPEER